ncbi:MAG: type II toxin-antitoxin system RelE/ParE family toxin [Eubacteriales bacterium]|nr:type II toxin-antitoxin system RelE/ParE family toxin [Eubacteriales bacterium]
MILRYTPAAIADLQETKTYISKVLHNPRAARRIALDVLNRCALLKEHPLLGMSLAAKTGEDTDLRYLLCEQHIAFYRVEGELILIARILDSRTDYMQLLLRDK